MRLVGTVPYTLFFQETYGFENAPVQKQVSFGFSDCKLNVNAGPESWDIASPCKKNTRANKPEGASENGLTRELGVLLPVFPRLIQRKLFLYLNIFSE